MAKKKLNIKVKPKLPKAGGGKIILPQQQSLTSQDSLYHQRDKTIKYDEVRGGAFGNPLPKYSDTSYYNQFYKDKVEHKLDYYQTAMEKGDAGDFIFNTGKDPRIYAYQEYLRKTDPSNKTGWRDDSGGWKNRKNLPSNFDQIYSNTIGKLPENDRRIAINNGRDWYYKNTYTKDPGMNWGFDAQGNPIRGKDGSLSPAYAKTWYGRIWNNNDFNDFDPNNLKFTPQKQSGGSISPKAQDGVTLKDRFKIKDTYQNSPIKFNSLGDKDYGFLANTSGLNFSGGLNLQNEVNPTIRTGVGYRGNGLDFNVSPTFTKGQNQINVDARYNKGDWNGNFNYRTLSSFGAGVGYNRNGFNTDISYNRNNNINSFNTNIGYDGEAPVRGGLNYGYNQEGEGGHKFGANINADLGKHWNINANANADLNKNYRVNAGLNYKFQSGGSISEQGYKKLPKAQNGLNTPNYTPNVQAINLQSSKPYLLHTHCPECEEWSKLIHKPGGASEIEVEQYSKLYPQYGNIETVPYKQGSYFTRPRQSQEPNQNVGQFPGKVQGKTDYFDKKTGHLLGTYGNGGLLKAKDGLITDPRHDSYYTPSSSDRQISFIQGNTKGKDFNPIQLKEVNISAKRQLDPSKKAFSTVYPDKTGSSADLAFALFAAPIGEAFHTPSRLINQGIRLGQGKGLGDYTSEISETLGLQNSDPTDYWTGARNFAINNAADFIAPTDIPIRGVNTLENAAFKTGEYVESANKTKNILQGYREQLNPQFINPQEQEMLHTVRNIGMSMKGEDDIWKASTITNVLDRAKSLTDEQFKTLTGFEKSELSQRLEGLNNGTLKKPEEQLVDGLTREEYIIIGVRNRRPRTEQSRQELQNLSHRLEDPPAEVNIPTDGQSFYSNNRESFRNNTQGGDYGIDRFAESYNTNQLLGTRFDNFLYKNEPNIIDKFNDKLGKYLSNKQGFMEKAENSGDIQQLVPGLYASQGEKEVKRKLFGAIKTLENAPKGSQFIPAHSLSSDSYPLSYRILPRFLEQGKVDLSFHGMQDFNPLGFSDKVGISSEVNMKEINSVIRDLNQKLDKKIPYARIKDGQIKAPIISATRKKFGGKVSQWEIMEEGGSISQQGYRDDSPYRNRESININTPNGLIDMSQTGIPLLANGRYLPPYSGMHKFNTNKVKEIPIRQNGGSINDEWEIVEDLPKAQNGLNTPIKDPRTNSYYTPKTDNTEVYKINEDKKREIAFPLYRNSDKTDIGNQSETVKKIGLYNRVNNLAKYNGDGSYSELSQKEKEGFLNSSDTANYLATIKMLDENNSPYIDIRKESLNQDRIKKYNSVIAASNYSEGSPGTLNLAMFEPQREFISELSHSQQDRDKWKQSSEIDKQLQNKFEKERIKNPNLNYSNFYDANYYTTPGTIEYDAHHIRQPELQKRYDFLKDSFNKEVPNMTFSTSYPFSKKQQDFEKDYYSGNIGKFRKVIDTNFDNLLYGKPIKKNGGLIKAQTGKLIPDPRQQYIPSSSDKQSEWEIVDDLPKFQNSGFIKKAPVNPASFQAYQQANPAKGAPTNPVMLNEVYITAPRAQYPTELGKRLQYDRDEYQKLKDAAAEERWTNSYKGEEGLGNDIIGEQIGFGALAKSLFSIKPIANELAGIGKNAIQNTYKINPWALKENPNTVPFSNLLRGEQIATKVEIPNRNVYTLGNDADYSRYLTNNPEVVPINFGESRQMTAAERINVDQTLQNLDNPFPPPPPEINRLFDDAYTTTERQALNNRYVDWVNNNSTLGEANLNIPAYIRQGIDLDKYKGLTYNDLILKNPTLAEKLKAQFSKISNQVKQSLSDIDKSAGKYIDSKLHPQVNFNDVVAQANQNLQQGMGVSKGKFDIKLEPFGDATKGNNFVNVHINGEHTGYLGLPSTTNERTLSDIVFKKPFQQSSFINSEIPGLRKASDFPFQTAEAEKLYKKKGVSGEINKAISEALKSKNQRLYSGATGHSDDGLNRYQGLLKKGLVEEIKPNIFMYKKFGGNVNSDWEILSNDNEWELV